MWDSMSIKVRVDLTRVDDRIINYAKSRQSKFRQMVLKDTTPYVPVDTGELRRSGQVTSKGVAWTDSKASTLYYSNMRFRTPGTTNMWVMVSKNNNLNRWLKELG